MYCLVIACAGQCFSQTKKIIPVDSAAMKFPTIISATEKNIGSSVKRELESRFLDSLRFMKSFVSATTKNIFKTPFRLVNATIDYSGITDSSYLYNGRQYLGYLDAFSSWMIFSVPVAMGYRNQSWSDAAHPDRGQFSFRYDRNNYLDELRNKLNKKFKPQNLLQTVIDPLMNVKRDETAVLQKDLAGINDQYGHLLTKTISSLGNPDSLFTKEMSAIRQQFFSNDFLKSIQDKERLYSQLIQKKNSGQPVNMRELQSLDSSLRQAKGIEAVMNKIEEHKRKWDSSGLVKRIKE